MTTTHLLREAIALLEKAKRDIEFYLAEREEDDTPPSDATLTEINEFLKGQGVE